MACEWIKLFIPYSESENVATRKAIEGGKSLAITDIGRLSGDIPESCIIQSFEIHSAMKSLVFESKSFEDGCVPNRGSIRPPPQTTSS